MVELNVLVGEAIEFVERLLQLATNEAISMIPGGFSGTTYRLSGGLL